MTAAILKRLKQEIDVFELQPSKGGCFELTLDGELVYSKLQEGRFPDEAALVDTVAERASA